MNAWIAWRGLAERFGGGPWPGRLVYWLAIGLVLRHFGGFITQDSYRPEFNHFDEANWIWISYHAWERAWNGAWSDPFWTEPYANWGSPSPALGKFFIGGPVWWFLEKNPDIALHQFGNFNSVREESVWPPFQLYYPARLQAAFFMLATTLLVMDLARQLFGFWVGAVTGFLFIHHPYIVSSSFRAMTDACGLFGMTLLLWGLFRRRTAMLALASGLGLGWAAATRLNGLVMTPALALTLGLRWRRGETLGRTLGAVGLILGLTAATFFGTNPLLWSRPVEGFRLILAHRPGPDFLPMRDVGFFIQLLKGLALQASWDVETFQPRSPVGPLMGLVLAVFGLAIVVRTRQPERRLFIFVAFAVWGALLATMPVDWRRYYLPGVAPWVILTAYGLVVSLRMAWPWMMGKVREGREWERLESKDAKLEG